MARTIYADARRTLAELNGKMRDLMDVAKIPDGAPLDREIQGALNRLYAAFYKLPGEARDASALRSPILIYPVRGRDMRDWFTSDQRPSRSRAAYLLRTRRASRVASRIASAARVELLPEDHPFRPITASQFIDLLDNAVVTDGLHSNGGYEPSRSFIH